jgi:hypothetical protein
MELTKKIVTEFPLNHLWTSEKILEAERDSYLTRQDIKQILKVQPVTFVVANVGESLKWITNDDSYSFWKNQAQEHIADDVEHIEIDNCPDQYAFIASKWNNNEQVTIILLEKIH